MTRIAPCPWPAESIGHEAARTPRDVLPDTRNTMIVPAAHAFPVVFEPAGMSCQAPKGGPRDRSGEEASIGNAGGSQSDGGRPVACARWIDRLRAPRRSVPGVLRRNASAPDKGDGARTFGAGDGREPAPFAGVRAALEGLT